MNKSEGQILSALVDKGGPFAAPAHAVLRGVRNKTGYGGGAERYADGLVVSLFPSRGIWFAGVEVKVSRSDWMRELNDPEKSEAIQRFCAYWWIATPPGVVKLDELPPTWGLIEVTDKGKCKRVKNAPLLEPEPPTTAFVASIMRSAETRLGAEYRRGCDATHAKYTDAATKVRDAERTQRQAEAKVAQLERDLVSAKEALEDAMAIVDIAGVRGEMWRVRYSNNDDKAEVAKAVKRALAMLERRDDLKKIAVAFRAASDDIDNALAKVPTVDAPSVEANANG